MRSLTPEKIETIINEICVVISAGYVPDSLRERHITSLKNIHELLKWYVKVEKERNRFADLLKSLYKELSHVGKTKLFVTRRPIKKWATSIRLKLLSLGIKV